MVLKDMVTYLGTIKHDFLALDSKYESTSATGIGAQPMSKVFDHNLTRAVTRRFTRSTNLMGVLAFLVDYPFLLYFRTNVVNAVGIVRRA